MAPRRRTPGIAVSNLQEDLQQMPAGRAVGKADSRSLGKSRRLMERLSHYEPEDVANALELSNRKYAALRRGVAQGKISSPTLNVLLEQAEQRMYDQPTFARETFIAEIPHKGRRKVSVDVWEMPEPWVRKNLPWSKDLKPGGFGSKQSALNWLGNVGGAQEYFQVVRKQLKRGGFRYHIYDIRTPRELQRKGRLKTAPKGQRILKKYR